MVIHHAQLSDASAYSIPTYSVLYDVRVCTLDNDFPVLICHVCARSISPCFFGCGYVFASFCNANWWTVGSYVHWK